VSAASDGIGKTGPAMIEPDDLPVVVDTGLYQFLGRIHD
jgi:hypothetical protein